MKGQETKMLAALKISNTVSSVSLVNVYKTRPTMQLSTFAQNHFRCCGRRECIQQHTFVKCVSRLPNRIAYNPVMKCNKKKN